MLRPYSNGMDGMVLWTLRFGEELRPSAPYSDVAHVDVPANMLRLAESVAAWRPAAAA
jgi:non-homologous end joining protein Ku